VSPYIVRRGEVHSGAMHYRCGEFVPGAKGELGDMEAVGAVEWVDSPPREPAPKPQAKKPAAKRKAVK